MKITEEPLAERTASSIVGAADEGAELLGISADEAPLKIVESLNAYIAKPPRKRKKVDNWTDRALPLGALWGQQMVREFGWEWAYAIHHDHDGAKFAGVFNKNRSLAIYPFEFVYGCLENQVYPTILLAFNMLVAGKIPECEAGSYTNQMDGVHHIVPPG